ncbi:hypothetical protein CXG81DRAFT_24922 [Caulochytrium protostelioides]|uniref:MFS general substrate transporter n=1 Tax=Caulochytrium protostelioides TaxID=1555241 RepID=A0A4P9XBH9_9FUNG|nr:hypothetical protein CXG81DRAFT_24922 [Caulochytrium protostelioides]|eukprot:RKP02461.1 hypothetical protein CXG81DRAFT_24922 [Caulochytrium protostelioides]
MARGSNHTAGGTPRRASHDAVPLISAQDSSQDVFVGSGSTLNIDRCATPPAGEAGVAAASYGPAAIALTDEAVVKSSNWSDDLDLKKPRRPAALARQPSLAVSLSAAAASEGPSQEARVVREYTKKVLHMGIGFCLLFTAFSTSQGFLTTMYPNSGSYSISIVWSFYGMFSLLAPMIGNMIGYRNAIALGVVGYFLMVLSMQFHNDGLILVVSCICGIGAALTWINQGIWLALLTTRVGTQYVGHFTGMFFMIVNVNGIVGNILSIVILKMGVSTTLLLWVLLAIGCLGVGVIATADSLNHLIPSKTAPAAGPPAPSASAPSPLRKSTLSRSSANMTQSQHFRGVPMRRMSSHVSMRSISGTRPPAPGPPVIAQEDATSLSGQVMGLIRVALMRKTLWLWPTIWLQGANSAFTYNLLPKLLPGKEAAEVPMMFLVWGCIGVVLALLNGKVYDRFGNRPLAVMIGCCGFVGYTLLTLVLTGRVPALLTLMFCCGLLSAIDVTTSSIINFDFSNNYEKGPQTSAGFGFYRFLLCIAGACSSLLAANTSRYFMLSYVSAIIVVAVAAYLLGGKDMTRPDSAEAEPPRSQHHAANTVIGGRVASRAASMIFLPAEVLAACDDPLNMEITVPAHVPVSASFAFLEDHAEEEDEDAVDGRERPLRYGSPYEAVAAGAAATSPSTAPGLGKRPTLRSSSQLPMTRQTSNWAFASAVGSTAYRSADGANTAASTAAVLPGVPSSAGRDMDMELTAPAASNPWSGTGLSNSP